jgi:HSP20 family protein
MAKKRSFFERLTGTVSLDDYDDVFEDEYSERRGEPRQGAETGRATRPVEPAQEMAQPRETWLEEEAGEGQLAIDVYQNPEEIIIRAHVAGVKPDDLDISITRDMVTIKGKREEAREVEDDNYFYKELYWGSFSRTILLPQEVEVEEAQANEKHGMLTIRLPKIDKERQTKLKVKGN